MQVNQVKDGVIRYLKQEYYGMLQNLKIDQCFQGWKHVINDMALNNELADVRTINVPNLKSQKVETQDWFTFADFLTPGYH